MIALTGLIPRAIVGFGAALTASLLVPFVRERLARRAGIMGRRARARFGRTVPEDGQRCGALHECTADAADVF